MVLCLACGAAWADVPPADVSGCSGKSAGEACKRDDGSDGTCASSKCGKLDYSEGVPPKAVEYDCMKCELKAAAPAPKPPEEKKSSCAALPGEALLALGALLALRRRNA
ncbi:MAG: hypothetical protein DI536_00265 [Archangium gephyra]|uniref:Uncharacterized protein n=1 Tax=Archangium gephyra TaxID=48 RepID=A0A2W5U420_9BACT|nr:MAG: hypothetical protein DI536_00265 [Archangium gephyra]